MAADRVESNQAIDWLVGRWQWPYACLFTACILLSLTPIWINAAGTALALVVLQLPIYMVHQFEEHTGDRFRTYFNKNIAGGCDALTPDATFWINALGVWGIVLVASYLACFVNLSYGLIAMYLALVNALTHIREAIVRRECNPGLCTSLVLFLPIAGWGLYVVSVASGATWVDHLLGAGVAVAVHVAIIVYVVLRVMKLHSTPNAASLG